MAVDILLSVVVSLAVGCAVGVGLMVLLQASYSDMDMALDNCGIGGIYAEFDGPGDAIRQMSHYIREGDSKGFIAPYWISVEERLPVPDDGEAEYWVIVSDGEVDIYDVCFYLMGDGWFEPGCDYQCGGPWQVTHWMPIRTFYRREHDDGALDDSPFPRIPVKSETVEVTLKVGGRGKPTFRGDE